MFLPHVTGLDIEPLPKAKLFMEFLRKRNMQGVGGVIGGTGGTVTKASDVVLDDRSGPNSSDKFLDEEQCGKVTDAWWTTMSTKVGSYHFLRDWAFFCKTASWYRSAV